MQISEASPAFDNVSVRVFSTDEVESSSRGRLDGGWSSFEGDASCDSNSETRWLISDFALSTVEIWSVSKNNSATYYI